MRFSSQRIGRWVGYAAAAWALLFAGFHVLWAAGWYVGLDPEQSHEAFERPWFLAYDLAVAGLCLLGGAVALALVQPWGRRLPRRLIGAVAWAGTGLLALRGGGGAVRTAYLAAMGRDVLDRGLVWEVWFCVGAILFWLSVRRFRRVAVSTHEQVATCRERGHAGEGEGLVEIQALDRDE